MSAKRQKLFFFFALLVTTLCMPHVGHSGSKPKKTTPQSVQDRAESGNAAAQYKLGSMYETGLGFPQNYDEAAYWYRSAAQQGHPDAQYSLGRLLAMGKGVSQNYFESYLWLNLAASKTPSEKFVRARDQAARFMRPRELAEAQEQSVLCLRSDYVNCYRPRGLRDLRRN